ncbi:DNA polymerase III subunit gamma and tau [Microbacterium sp. P02]|uniref:DNA polymerase III subunit gamma and tau n=1 Tax=Microbacterium sp. P02 TaxID=3366260 RepID=UPI00366EF48E
MTTALYRRYRPETFGEMIGQAQVTDPLMTALRGDRVGHAYLFSGPRGCGKTTSARILARCLNCAQGPTDVPCGECDSCVELGRGGGGSLDVVEIDAASHNGVDDARDLRERAIFAPARDRFKIFILDEAHMVTPQGFNALLKLVEEPPDHVKFIFATTEPEKVIGTIRSRTHHYPFRLVPPAAMLEYVQAMCELEGVQVEPGVLPLVVRAGGGSPRDTLSLLDQLIAGSDASAETGTVVVRYERAVSLLGYTHAELLDEVVDAFGEGDPAAAFAAVDRVVQTGQDPRRFVDDLLERLRDLIIIAATGQGAAAVLRGVPADELERMSRQASIFGSDRLSRTADLVIGTLDEMTGATSPRLQLELMVARVLAHTGASAAPAAPAPSAAPASVPPPSTGSGSSRTTSSAPESSRPSTPAATVPGPTPPAPAVSAHDMRSTVAATAAVSGPTTTTPSGPVTLPMVRDSWTEVLRNLEDISRTSWLVASNARVLAFEGDVLTLAFQSQGDVAKFKQLNRGAGPSEDLRQAIQAVLGIRVKYIARHDPVADSPTGSPTDPGLRDIGEVPDDPQPPNDPYDPYDDDPTPPDPGPRPSTGQAARTPAAPVTDWVVASIPREAPAESLPAGRRSASDARTGAPPASAGLAVDDEPEDAAADLDHARTTTLAPPREGEVLPADVVAPVRDDDAEETDVAETPEPDAPVPPVVAPRLPISTGGVQRYGEAVVRQVLGATFVREEPYNPPTRFS